MAIVQSPLGFNAVTAQNALSLGALSSASRAHRTRSTSAHAMRLRTFRPSSPPRGAHASPPHRTGAAPAPRRIGSKLPQRGIAPSSARARNESIEAAARRVAASPAQRGFGPKAPQSGFAPSSARARSVFSEAAARRVSIRTAARARSSSARSMPLGRAVEVAAWGRLVAGAVQSAPMARGASV